MRRLQKGDKVCTINGIFVKLPQEFQKHEIDNFMEMRKAMDLTVPPSDESNFNAGEEEAVIRSESTLKLGLCKFIWAGSFLAVAGALIYCLLLAVHVALLWRFSVYNKADSNISVFEASVFVGMEVGLLAMAVLLAFLIPRMIMTWTIALVFQYVFGKARGSRREMVVEDGSKIALELSIGTLFSVVTKGNRVVITVVILCLISATFGKNGLYFEKKMLSY